MNYEFELKQLIKLVLKTRQAQNKFFANKDSRDRFKYLSESKDKERELDAKIVELNTNINQIKLDL